MKRMIHWLGSHRLLTALLAFSFYLSVVVFHGEVTRFAISLRKSLGIESYNLFISIAAQALLVVIVIFMIKWLWNTSQKPIKIAWSLITVLLIGIFYKFALTYNIEAIHFVQYMILAILLFPLIKSYGLTVFWVTMLGVIDEIYQYTVLTPFFNYFDLNDMILNLLGAGLGVVLIFISADVPAKERKWYMLSSLWFAVAIATLFIILGWAGEFYVFPTNEAMADDPLIILNRELLGSNFWTEAYQGRYFHIIKPGEGVIIMMILFVFYQVLDPLSQRFRSQA